MFYRIVLFKILNRYCNKLYKPKCTNLFFLVQETLVQNKCPTLYSTLILKGIIMPTVHNKLYTVGPNKKTPNKSNHGDNDAI